MSIVYLDQIKPAGSLRPTPHSTAATLSAAPVYAYEYDESDWSVVALHSAAFRRTCGWRAVAFTRAEVEREALAHHVAEHQDNHASGGRRFQRSPGFERDPEPDAPTLARLLRRLRLNRERFLKAKSIGAVKSSISRNQQQLVVNALETVAADPSDPELQSWAQGLLAKNGAIAA